NGVEDKNGTALIFRLRDERIAPAVIRRRQCGHIVRGARHAMNAPCEARKIDLDVNRCSPTFCATRSAPGRSSSLRASAFGGFTSSLIIDVSAQRIFLFLDKRNAVERVAVVAQRC